MAKDLKKIEQTPEESAKKTVKGEGKSKKRRVALGHEVLRGVIETEKSSLGNQLGKYYFKVNPEAGRNKIKQAIEDYYAVSVTKVNIINSKPKRKRSGLTEGKRKGIKKAIVTLKEGDSLSI